MHFAHVKKHYPVLKNFQRHVLSFKEKVRKPDERIYRKALAAARAQAHEVIYIDDREDLTSAAKELGFHVHTFRNDRPKLEKLLKKHGVL
jgi:HAD superfamily hydrolase (TIGR01509 family)